MKNVDRGGYGIFDTYYAKYWIKFQDVSRIGENPNFYMRYSPAQIAPLEVELNETGEIDVHFELTLPSKEEVVKAVSILRNKGFDDPEIARQLMMSEELWNLLTKKVTPPFLHGIRIDDSIVYRGDQLRSCFFYRSDVWDMIGLYAGLKLNYH